MKIFDLNVNNFGGIHDKKPQINEFSSPWEYKAERDTFQKDSQRVVAMEAIACAIKKEKPDVVILQEFDVNAPAGKKLAQRLYESSYCPIYPHKEEEDAFEKTPSITIMFVKNFAVDRYFSPGSERKAWKWCGIGIDDLLISGVHFPAGKEYLYDVERYAKKHKNEKLIIIGDFNIATNEWRARQVKDHEFHERRQWLLETMPGLGYFDAVDGEEPTYFWTEKGEVKGTTIDHVLISPALQEKATVTARVISRAELELSDHAVIIVNIEE